jgi:2-C-methyl-D-erythritol 4-phosphate cytidylyltransferase
MNVCVIIPAAGRSKRFGGQDKLSQDLGGRALLLRTVELFAKRDEVRSIIVAGPPDTFDAFREKYGPTLSFHGVTLVEGGREARWETVKNALAAVPDDVTHIAVHDAARPAASHDLLNRLFQAAQSLPAVIPAVPIAGTVKKISAEILEIDEAEEDAVADLILGDEGKVTVPTHTVIETIDRSNLVEVQTPQVFHAELFRRAYAASDLSGTTDDAGLVERLGETVHVVDGEVTNIKVTTNDDLKLIRAILGVKPPAERPVHKRF